GCARGWWSMFAPVLKVSTKVSGRSMPGGEGDRCRARVRWSCSHGKRASLLRQVWFAHGPGASVRTEPAPCLHTPGGVRPLVEGEPAPLTQGMLMWHGTSPRSVRGKSWRGPEGQTCRWCGSHAVVIGSMCICRVRLHGTLAKYFLGGSRENRTLQ